MVEMYLGGYGFKKTIEIEVKKYSGGDEGWSKGDAFVWVLDADGLRRTNACAGGEVTGGGMDQVGKTELKAGGQRAFPGGNN